MSEKVNSKNGGGKLKLVIIALLLVIVVGGGAFTGYYFFFAKKAGSDTNTLTNGIQVNTADPNGVQGVGTGTQGSNIYQVSTGTFELGEFLVNLSDDNNKKYIKVKVFLGYDVKNKKLAKELEEKKPIVRDAIISVLRSKKSPDLNQKGVEDLKTQILMRINPFFKEGKPQNIYFDEFLIQ